MAKEERGLHFKAKIYDDYVIKEPLKRHEIGEERLKEISELSVELSRLVEEVKPAYLVENGTKLWQERARGRRFTEKEWYSFGMKRAKELQSKVRSLGFELKDIGFNNLFYDAGAKSLEIVDLHGIYKK